MDKDEYPGIIGIDLGTTYSCVAFWNKDRVEIITNKLGKNTTPSWVAFTDTETLVGEPAKKQAASNQQNTIFGVKRLMGKRFSEDQVQQDLEMYSYRVTGDTNDTPTIHVKYKGEDRKFKPEQISALILEEMRGIAEAKLGMKVKRAVVTVPAYFNDSQRTATKHAAQIAGLDCEKILNEPTAACMCYGLEKKENGAKVLIFDLGGGTFDVSILNLYNGIFEVLSTSGNTHLGGEDFDNIIINKLIDEFAQKKKVDRKLILKDMNDRAMGRLKSEAEEAKKSLSMATEVSFEIDNFYHGEPLLAKLSRRKFELWCDHLFQKCLEPVKSALEDAQLERNQISEIVLVGGSTRIPKIQDILSKFFDGAKLNRSVNPDEAVAYGAAVQGAILSKNDESGKTKELLLLDVTPLSIGIRAKDGVMSKIIPRNTQIPATESKVYTTVEDGQTSVQIDIYEGERQFVKDNHKIGNFELTDIPRQPRGAAKIEVKLHIDTNGILTVKAIDRDSGCNNEIRVTDTTRLTQEEINKMVDEAEEFRADDELRKEALTSRYEFEKELDFVMSSINNPDLNTDDKGCNILTPEEIDYMNECILVNLTWLEENAENLSKEKITNASNQFKLGTKPIMSKVYARKKQLDMAREYQDVSDDLINNQELVDNAFMAAEVKTETKAKVKVKAKAKAK
jgi:molecular chaperone DnaK (HSP70)